ncbi:MAG TPA: isopentenyl transferase family protein, partial [Syntrophales bacterium]|nr:isopentenyl transferase family protein [Syntrophales bacterium]
MIAKEPAYNLIVILGPTASGKTRLAVHLALERRTEIISADSRQVYRGMDIGTGKDLADYVIDGTTVPYHLIDIVDPASEFSVFDYQTNFFRVFGDMSKRGIVAIMVGGTGLYIEAVLRGYDLPVVPPNPKLREELEQLGMPFLTRRLVELNPRLHNTTDLADRKRLIRAIEIAEFGRSLDCRKLSRPAVRALTLGIRWDR